MKARKRGAPPLFALWHHVKHGVHVELPRGAAKVRITRDDVVADLGGYVGGFSTRCADAGAKSVVAYEPSPWAFAALHSNASARTNMKAVNAAVVGTSDRATARMNVTTKCLGCSNSLVSSPRDALAITVKTVPYREAVEGASIIKIDVEGSEYEYPLTPSSARAIFLSFHNPKSRDWQADAKNIMADLVKHGFTAVIEPDLSRGASPLFRESL